MLLPCFPLLHAVVSIPGLLLKGNAFGCASSQTSVSDKKKRCRMVIVHRFAFALAYGAGALDQVRVLVTDVTIRCVSGSDRGMWWRPPLHRSVVSGDPARRRRRSRRGR
jgi:hypothetical protein